MNKAPDDFLSFNELDTNQQKICRIVTQQTPLAQELILSAKTRGEQLPQILLKKGESLIYLRIAGLENPGKSAFDTTTLTNLEANYQQIQSNGQLSDQASFGLRPQFFWYARLFSQQTLASYLTENELSTEQANFFLLKIIDLLLANQRCNIAHGHLCLSNLQISDKSLSLVDSGLFAAKAAKYSSDWSSDAAPELKQMSNATFAADIYGFGRIIKALYRGIKCPLPYDLSDQMIESSPQERPNLITVNNTITDAFAKKRSRTEHWNVNAQSSHYGDTRLNQYLTPVVLEKIRAANKKTRLVPQQEKFLQKYADKLRNQAGLRKVTGLPSDHWVKRALPYALTFLALSALVVVYNSGRQTPQVVTEPMPASQEVTVAQPQQGVSKEKIESLAYAVKLLKMAELTEAAGLIRTLDLRTQPQDSFYIRFFRTDSARLFQVKLQSLLLIYGQNKQALAELTSYLQTQPELNKYLNWFRINPIAEWTKLGDALKLLLISGNLPNKSLSSVQNFDLLKHFDPALVSSTETFLLVNLPASQTEFYTTLIRLHENLTRPELNFLIAALSREPKEQGALLASWFKQTSTPAEIVLKLILSRKETERGEDLFSFYGSRFLKGKKIKISPEEKSLMLKHHERQLGVIARKNS